MVKTSSLELDIARLGAEIPRSFIPQQDYNCPKQNESGTVMGVRWERERVSGSLVCVTSLYAKFPMIVDVTNRDHTSVVMPCRFCDGRLIFRAGESKTKEVSNSKSAYT